MRQPANKVRGFSEKRKRRSRKEREKGKRKGASSYSIEAGGRRRF